MTLVATTITSVFGKDMALVLQVEQGPVVMVAAQDNAAALTTISTVGTTVGVVLDMTQVHTALTALTRAAHDLYVVYEVTLHLDIVNHVTDISKDAVELAQTVDVIVDSLLLVPLDKRLRLISHLISACTVP